MNYCPNFKGVLTATNDTGLKMAIVARCKSWYCPTCAKMNRAKWAAVLLDHINKSECKTWGWFTLTAHEKSHEKTGQYSLKNIARAWDRLVKRMRRKFGHFEYCRVYERHKSGAYHLHCIHSFQWDDLVKRGKGKKTAMDSRWLRSTARSLGMGYKTHADNIPREKCGTVAFYVTKYMVKLEDEKRNEWGRARRIQTSRGIKYNSKITSEYEWTLKSGLWEHDFIESVGSDEKQVYLLNEKRFLDSDDFTGTIVWPPDE